MSNLTNNTSELRDILAAVNALPDAGSGAPAEDLTAEIEAQAALIEEQAGQIEELLTVLDEKAAGVVAEMCAVSVSFPYLAIGSLYRSTVARISYLDAAGLFSTKTYGGSPTDPGIKTVNITVPQNTFIVIEYNYHSDAVTTGGVRSCVDSIFEGATMYFFAESDGTITHS